MHRTPNPYRNSSNEFQPQYDLTVVQAWFNVLIQDKWKRINMINFDQPDSCCHAQIRRYLVFGYHNRNWSPGEYLEKITNYEDEYKPLNFLAAAWSSETCENIILEVGFGPGNFRRSHHQSVKEGEPYIMAGEQHQIGIPHVASRAFPYDNPGQFLTFHWFKHNIMCKAQPWICEENEKEPKEDTKKEKKVKTGCGSKKSKRKNKKPDQSGFQGQSSVRTDRRRI